MFNSTPGLYPLDAGSIPVPGCDLKSVQTWPMSQNCPQLRSSGLKVIRKECPVEERPKRAQEGVIFGAAVRSSYTDSALGRKSGGWQEGWC